MRPDPQAVIRIKELKLKVVIGTRPDERLAAQDILADISFTYDASLAAAADALGHAVDYGAMHARILERVAVTKFMLLEKLAAFILDIIMEETKVVSATVILQKAGALAGAGAVSVSMSATRCC